MDTAKFDVFFILTTSLTYIIKNKRGAITMSFIMTLLQVFSDFPALFGYIKGQTFSKPLSSEEESLILERYLAGDEEARLILIERNMRLVAHVVKKFHPSHDQLDDYISIGTIGLVKAVESFTPNKKTKLATFAARCIENEILMHLRTQKKVAKDVSLFEPIGTDKEGQALQIQDLLQFDDAPTDEKIETKERLQQLYRFLTSLDPRELEIITLRYGLFNEQFYTQKEIAERLSISRSYVSRIEKRALIKLYQQFKQL